MKNLKKEITIKNTGEKVLHVTKRMIFTKQLRYFNYWVN